MRQLIAICTLLMLATPAQANWLGFDWGMTEAEVEKASSEVEVFRLETEKKKRMRPSTSSLGGKWAHNGQEYQLFFFFDPEGQLEFIDIEPVGVECSERNSLFAEQFGKYEEETTSLGPATRTTRYWKLERNFELFSLVLHLHKSDTWNCQAMVRNPAPWASR